MLQGLISIYILTIERTLKYINVMNDMICCFIFPFWQKICLDHILLKSVLIYYSNIAVVILPNYHSYILFLYCKFPGISLTIYFGFYPYFSGLSILNFACFFDFSKNYNNNDYTFLIFVLILKKVSKIILKCLFYLPLSCIRLLLFPPVVQQSLFQRMMKT